MPGIKCSSFSSQNAWLTFFSDSI